MARDMADRGQLKLCVGDHDPSFAIRRKAQAKRTLTWSEGEVARLVKAAIRIGQPGLACIVAVAWDTQFSPGDARTLTAANLTVSDGVVVFERTRSKTGKAAIGTVSRRTARLVGAYLAAHPPGDIGPLFRNTGGEPYPTVDRLTTAFARLRARVFPGDTRTAMDMRRSGAVEANAGGVDAAALAAKMANNINQAAHLQETYMPVNPVSVARADEARRQGRARLR